MKKSKYIYVIVDKDNASIPVFENKLLPFFSDEKTAKGMCKCLFSKTHIVHKIGKEQIEKIILSSKKG